MIRMTIRTTTRIKRAPPTKTLIMMMKLTMNLEVFILNMDLTVPNKIKIERNRVKNN